MLIITLTKLSETLRGYKNIKYPKVVANWDRGDWLAWSGGKNWYSSLDEGDANYDAKVNYNGHHADFKLMLEKMESTARFNYGTYCAAC